MTPVPLTEQELAELSVGPLIGREEVAERLGVDFGGSDTWIQLVPISTIHAWEADRAALVSRLEAAESERDHFRTAHRAAEARLEAAARAVRLARDWFVSEEFVAMADAMDGALEGAEDA